VAFHLFYVFFKIIYSANTAALWQIVARPSGSRATATPLYAIRRSGLFFQLDITFTNGSCCSTILLQQRSQFDPLLF